MMKKVYSGIFILLAVSILFVSCAAPATPKYATYDEYLATINPYSSSSVESVRRKCLSNDFGVEHTLNLRIYSNEIDTENFDKIVFINPDTNEEYGTEECRSVEIKNEVVISPTYPDNKIPYFEHYYHKNSALPGDKHYGEESIEITLFIKVGNLTDVVIRALDKDGNTIDEQYLNIDALLDYWLRQGIITADELPSDWSYDKNWSYGGYSPT